MADADKAREENVKALEKLAKEGKIPMPRPLLRKERKEMDKKKMNMWMSSHDPNDRRGPMEVQSDCSDFIVDTFFPECNWDEMPNDVVLSFAMRVLALTYKDTLSEKN